MTDTGILRKLEKVQDKIAEDISSKTLIHMKNYIDDIVATEQAGSGIASMTNKLQNILNKRKSNETKIDHDMALDIFTNGIVNSDIIMDICAVNEKRSNFDKFFKICHELCMKRVSGALAKRHGSVEEVDHVTSIAELWRLGSKQIEILYTDENGVVDQDKVARNTPCYDYLAKQLLPKDDYIRKSERLYSSLNFKLALSGRSNHVKHVDFNYTQVTKSYLKQYAVDSKENAVFIQVDDKNKVL